MTGSDLEVAPAAQDEEQCGGRSRRSRSTSVSGDDTPGPPELRQPRRAPKRKASAGVGVSG